MSPKTQPKKAEVVRRHAIDDRDPQFENPLLRVAIKPVAELQKSDPGWKPIDNLHRLSEYEGYFEVLEYGVQ